jgi:hypothetical protein
MNMPDSKTFTTDVENTFTFLLDSGFVANATDRTSTPLTDEVVFRGENVAVSLALDRRDSCVDCYIIRVIDGELVRNDVPGGYWGHLHAFLVKRRGYRGSFKEYRDIESEFDWWLSDLKIYSQALTKLAPDIARDSEKVFKNDAQQSHAVGQNCCAGDAKR